MPNCAGGTYDCILLFAYYEVLDRKPLIEEIYGINNAVFLPVFCNGDYPAMELLHAGLIRRTTCSNGEVCDYWIVGDKSKYLKEHPKKTDGSGYLYNRYCSLVPRSNNKS